MRRVLLVGAGEVGIKHLEAITGVEDMTVVGVTDPRPITGLPAGLPRLTHWQNALERLAPDLVVVAAPPGTALTVARGAARTGAMVLVEKPVTVRAADLGRPEPADERIFVAFQPHFAPGLPGLLDHGPAVDRAEVTLVCRRDRAYYRTWRTHWATSGGVLHQQAIHGLALALRLLPPGDIASCDGLVRHERRWAESEDHVTAEVTFTSGAVLTVDARVDSDKPPRHEVLLHLADGQQVHVHGRNLEAGLGPATTAPDDRTLRREMYRALPAPGTSGPSHHHPSLFPLGALVRPLEVIDHVYRTARHLSPARPAQ
ncbi:Predicted dehydrogenase [Actinacidiphila yanglinensis]|uniref:Predicted dehydrogenase n=1 Tax=Actinacidiphila yanglinensis TaxID=310779 RepID=A0A1H6ED26_9ACTN|nr:Gfo/Idh/MocA family oxidoreductase [Actinacidiphila yanglinensis]SEG94856.1 Predicted dehydrogenase [Actinacidiphila yanglinensis]